MKTKLFLLASCLLAVVILNAQTPEAVVVESSEINASADVVRVMQRSRISFDEFGNPVQTVFINLSEPVSCNVSVGFEYIFTHPDQSTSSEYFSFTLSPGQTSQSQERTYYSSGGASITQVTLDHLSPSECDGKPIVYGFQ